MGQDMSQPAPGGAPAAGTVTKGEGDGPVRVSEGTPNPDRVFTLEELRKYDGSNPTGPIFLCANGVVFDVTSGAGFYGPGGSYGVFAGRDASRGLAKMDLKYTHCAVHDLTPSEKSTLREWQDKFDTKYPVVGKLVDHSEPNSGPAPEGGWPPVAAAAPATSASSSSDSAAAKAAALPASASADAPTESSSEATAPATQTQSSL